MSYTVVRSPERLTHHEIRLLVMLREAGGSMGHEDELLEPFCDDRGTLTDTFNMLHNWGMLKTYRDDRLDASTVHLTALGREALERRAP